MYSEELSRTAKMLVAEEKGLLAMDDSTLTCNKRFAAAGIPQTIEARAAYREWIVATPGLSDSISGVILYDETIRQEVSEGRSFVQLVQDAGIIPGIKVDLGTIPLAGHCGEKLTEGLDGLRERLDEYAHMGARFAKWRAVISIEHGIPSRACIVSNALLLALYASLCQEAGLVPIVEPEVIMDGDHSMERCSAVTTEVLRAVFVSLETQDVALDEMILKPNMILPGLNCAERPSLDQVAEATVNCLKGSVPIDVAGIAFLSGGQPAKLASARLSTMNFLHRADLPWPLAFSFARAVQQPALEIWKGIEANVPAAQTSLNHRALCNKAALHGNYTEYLENH